MRYTPKKEEKPTQSGIISKPDITNKRKEKQEKQKKERKGNKNQKKNEKKKEKKKKESSVLVIVEIRNGSVIIITRRQVLISHTPFQSKLYIVLFLFL